MDSKAWLTRLMALSLMLPVAACAGGDEEDVDVNVDDAPATTPDMASQPMTIQLEPMGGSSLTGQATATHGADQVNVRVSLNGLMEGQDYEATLRYGTCSMAQMHLDQDDGLDVGDVGDDVDAAPGDAADGAADIAMDDDAATPGTGTMEHEPGDEFADIDLEVTGMSATGTADVSTDDLSPTEDAYLVVVSEDMIVACGDLRGHGAMDGMDSPSGATPGAPATGDTAGY